MEAMKPDDPRFIGGVELLRRTGMTEFQLRFDEEQDPVVWNALAKFTGDRYVVGSALAPDRALFDLCERVIDGGKCVHCGRPSVFTPPGDEPIPGLTRSLCLYQWSDDKQVFDRACASSASTAP
jgi:hypothetical protein